MAYRFLPRETSVGAFILSISCAAAMAQTAPPPAVTVSPVVNRQVTETGDFVGRVMAIDKVDIVARVPGFIEQRIFTEGQQVKTGDLLFRIEQDTYKAAVEQQSANLAKAKATEVNAALQLQRGKELVKSQNVPQATVDQREAADEAGAGRRVASPGAARAGADQSRATRKFARRSTDGSVSPLSPSAIWSVRRPGRSRRSSARIRSTSSSRRASAISSNIKRRVAALGRQEPACHHPHQAARRHALSAAGRDQFPRRPGRGRYRHRGGAGATAESGGPVDARRHRRRRRRTRRAAHVAGRSPIRRAARPGRAAMSWWSMRRRRSSCGASPPAATRAATSS